MKSKILKFCLRNSSVNYSSEIFAKESALQTYWRGNLVSFNYKDLYEHSTKNNTQTVHNCLDSLVEENATISYLTDHIDKMKPSIDTYKYYSDDIKPVFVNRSNDLINIAWDDGSESVLNLNNLLKETKQIIKTNETSNFFDTLSPEQNQELDNCFKNLAEKTIATLDVSQFNNDLTYVCQKVAMRSEPSNYIYKFNNFKQAIPESFNGLLILQANKDCKLTFINGRILSNVYRFCYPEHFEQLVNQPSLKFEQEGCLDQECWQTVITLKDDGKSVDEIRFGDLDYNIKCPQYYTAYNEFNRLKNDFIRNLNGTFNSNNYSDYDSLYKLCEDAIIEIDVKSEQCVLIDTTCTWFAHEVENEDSSEILTVSGFRMIADNWKSSARCLGINV